MSVRRRTNTSARASKTSTPTRPDEVKRARLKRQRRPSIVVQDIVAQADWDALCEGPVTPAEQARLDEIRAGGFQDP